MQVQFDSVAQRYALRRTETAKPLLATGAQIQAAVSVLFPDDGATGALLALARQVPNIWHTVDNRQRNPRERWGRLCL